MQRPWRSVCSLSALVIFFLLLLPRDAMNRRGLCRHAVSVRSSVCHIRVLCWNEWTCLQHFSPSGIDTILVFPYQTWWQYSNWNSSNGVVECRWGRQKSRFSTSIWLLDRWLECDQQYTVDGAHSRSHLACPFTAQTATHQWILFITAPAAWTTMPKRTEHNLFVCICKPEAEVTNNRRLRSRYCTVEARKCNYWQTRSIARPLCDSGATCST